MRQFLVYRNAVLNGDRKGDGVREGCNLVPPEFVIRALSFLWTNGYDLCIIFDEDEWSPFRTSSIAVLKRGSVQKVAEKGATTKPGRSRSHAPVFD
jgi:hypothetical protein